MTDQLNRIPHQVLQQFNAQQATLLATGSKPGEVRLTTSNRPEDLHPAAGFEVLDRARTDEGVYSILMSILRLDNDLIDRATSYLENRYRLVSELDTLLRYAKHVYVVYVVTHFNSGWGPLGPLTVNIGGDCYRPERESLRAVLDRTRDLAKAMTRKAVMIFPDVPALHGGKKGEWIIVDAEGEKLDGLSREAIVALGSAIIPRGIEFLNKYKELEAIEQGILDNGFPERGVIPPDSASPDVLSGDYWRGEYPDKHINLCHAWFRRGEDMKAVTCLPAKLKGTLDPSARPTGYGVATTAMELAKCYFEPRKKAVGDLRFLLEAAGNVGQNTIEALIEEHGIRPDQITVFDPDNTAIDAVRDRHRIEVKGRRSEVTAIALSNRDFYGRRLENEAAEKGLFDVWINNGMGDQTTPEDVEKLLAAGVRVFTGGANNFLVTDEVRREEALRRIFDQGGWAWPDEATSGGGWTLAVMDVRTRCLERPADTSEIQRRILGIINSRNSQLVRDVLAQLPKQVDGKRLWDTIGQVIDERVEKTLAAKLTPEQVREQAKVEAWSLG